MKNYLLLLVMIAFLISGCESKQRTNYLLTDKELVPEGIAYSESMNKFYLTSIAKSKIIEVDRESGAQTDFISEKEYGFMPGVGLYVDDNKNLLYALGGYFRQDESLTSLFTFDLNSRELLKKYDVNDEGQHFLNDLIMDNNGNIYITDTKASSIYILKQGEDSLKLFFESDEIEYPNGIAISDDNTKLYVASYSKGVRSIDIQSKSVLNKADTVGISQGIDGLEFYMGDLFAIQNGIMANGDNFRKLELNETGANIVKYKVIDNNNPDLDIPLTFCIAGKQGVVIGNSNLQFMDQDYLTFLYPDSLKHTKLLIYDLPGKY